MTAGASGRSARDGGPAIRMRVRPALVLAVASVAGLLAFCWPLLVAAPTDGTSLGPPFILMALLPVLVALVVAELSAGGLDAKAVAVLAVLAAVGAALRPLGAGTAGIETVFFLLVLAGRVFGPAFGFVLGSVTLFASALITAGVGPWLPYQMIAASWVGLCAGLLPWRGRLRGRGELALLAAYGLVAAYLYGSLMNLAGWPFGIGADTQLSYEPGAPVLENVRTFVLYTLSTSAPGWDTGRALTNAVVIVLAGPAVLAALRRAARRARFDPPVSFEPAVPAAATVSQTDDGTART